MDQGTAWGQMTEKPAPLRVHLFRKMTEELQNRFQVAFKAPPGSSTYKELLDKQIILQDGSWPTLEWSHMENKYVLSKQKSLPMKDMNQLILDLQELGTEPSHIVRFFSMQQPTETRQSVAWKLQLQLRCANSHAVMERLVNSTIWILMGAMMKGHRPGQSTLCQQISSCLGNSRPNKGRGKGKAKNGNRSKPNSTS